MQSVTLKKRLDLTLEDRLNKGEGWVYMTGMQALGGAGGHGRAASAEAARTGRNQLRQDITTKTADAA